jgi:hypothetical protein
MIVTKQDGDTANITVDFGASPGTIDKNGHPVFTSDDEIDKFINTGVGYQPEPELLDVVANNLLLNNLKQGETPETIQALLI